MAIKDMNMIFQDLNEHFKMVITVLTPYRGRSCFSEIIFASQKINLKENWRILEKYIKICFIL